MPRRRCIGGGDALGIATTVTVQSHSAGRRWRWRPRRRRPQWGGSLVAEAMALAGAASQAMGSR